MLKGIFNFTARLIKVREIQKDSERRLTSKIYGFSAMVTAIFAVLFSLLFSWSIKVMQNGDLAALVVWVLVLIGALGAIVLLLNSIINWFMQLILNRRPFTWITLCVVLVSIGSCAFFVISALTA